MGQGTGTEVGVGGGGAVEHYLFNLPFHHQSINWTSKNNYAQTAA